MQLNLKKLSDAHALIMEMMASGQYSQTDIARIVGYSHEHISRLCTSDLFVKELEKRRELYREMFRKSAVDRLLAETEASLAKLVSIRDDPNTSKSLQLRATVEVLDRNPVTAKWHKGAQVPMQSQALSDEQIELITATFAMDPTAQIALAQARAVIDNAFDDNDDSLTNTPTPTESAASAQDADTNNSINSINSINLNNSIELNDLTPDAIETFDFTNNNTHGMEI